MSLIDFGEQGTRELDPRLRLPALTQSVEP